MEKKTIEIIAIQKSSMANREKLISHTNQTQYKCSYVTITQYLFFEMENTIPFCRVSNVKTSVGASYFFSLCRQSDAFVPVKSIVMGNFSSFQCFYFLCYKQWNKIYRTLSKGINCFTTPSKFLWMSGALKIHRIAKWLLQKFQHYSHAVRCFNCKV
jgi:hypothetical protein